MSNPPPPPPPAGGPPWAHSTPPPPPVPGAPPPAWAGSQPRGYGLALAAMIVGISGIFLFFVVVPSIVALILGLIAASQIKNSPGSSSRLGFARAGYILGAVGIAGFTVMLVVVALNLNEKSPLDLETGECIVLDDIRSPGVQRIDEVEVVDCDDEHTGEVVGVIELNPDRDREYPDDRTLFQEAIQRCIVEFESYAGTSIQGSGYDLFPIVTEELAWRGERGKTICIAVDLNGRDLDRPIGN